MPQRILAWVLLALTCYIASSKADIVSVPILNGQFTVNVMTGADAYQLQNIRNSATATQYTIYDDANVNVPLGFTFPYFGQGFTNSWMYSNGAVSFMSGNAPGGFCCSGINLTTEKNSGYNYSLLPLQTDLIGQTNNNFYTLGTGTSMTYGWYGINQYGSSNTSSFEVKIDNTGLIDYRFDRAFITNNTVTIGMTGDLAKGEYYQYYHGSNINQTNFGITGNLSAGYDVCSSDPLSSTTCAGYAAAYLTYQCSISSLYDSACPGYAAAYLTQQCTISALYDPSCPGYQAAYFTQQCNANQLYSTTCPGYASAYLTQQCNITQLYSTSCPGYQTAYAQKVALETQTKVATAEAPKSDSPPPGSPPPPPPGAPLQDATSAKAEVKLDLGGATISITGEIKPDDGIPDAARPPPPPELAGGSSPGPGGANPSLPPPPGSPAGFAERQPEAQQDRRAVSPVNALAIARNAVAATESLARAVASESARMSYSENANPSDGLGLNLERSGVKLNIPGLTFGAQSFNAQQETSSNNSTFYSNNSTTSLMTSESVQEQKYIPKQENSNSSMGIDIPTIPQQANSGNFENKASSVTAMQEQRVDNNETVKKDVASNDLAGGVDIASMAMIPKGYDAYSIVTLRDVPFYKTEPIYKDQRTIDNARVLRGLTGGSDSLHKRMVDSQYKLGN
jgi:hypothetical protein